MLRAPPLKPAHDAPFVNGMKTARTRIARALAFFLAGNSGFTGRKKHKKYGKTLDRSEKENYNDKMVEKEGIHFIRHEVIKENIDKEINYTKKGKFILCDYVITEKDQILPLYGLTFKRNEYLIVWRDPHFENDEFLKEKKLFIYEYSKMNAYFVGSIERALEIIKRKRFNKIILISNIGLDLSGKKLVEIARQILGFNVTVLFYSKNRTHLS